MEFSWLLKRWEIHIQIEKKEMENIFPTDQ
jgi:hypothetical protein